MLPVRCMNRTRRASPVPFFVLIILSHWAQPIHGQTFNSESNESDGELTLTNPDPTQPVTIDFDPKAFNPPLDPDGDGVYHFTSVTIGSGVTVRLSAARVSSPLLWLASGNVDIDGVIDLGGEAGQSGQDVLNGGSRRPAAGGAGGFAGGICGVGGTSDSPPQDGGGSGGGKIIAGRGGGGAGYAAPGGDSASNDDLCFAQGGGGGPVYGSAFLVPIVGGSGGAGGDRSGNSSGGGGGGGGGAILIASSSSITVNGTIRADGGAGGRSAVLGGGGGSGGGIRLAAPTIRGSGQLSANGGSRGPGAEYSGCFFVLDVFRGHGGSGAPGRVRLEAFQHEFTGQATPTAVLASPVRVYLDAQPAPPSLRVVRAAGVPVENPTASFTMPDVVTNTNAPITVEIEARNIPVGTIVKLHLVSENAGDQILDSTPLEGTQSQSMATVTVDQLPPGFSRGFVRARWGQ